MKLTHLFFCRDKELSVESINAAMAAGLEEGYSVSMKQFSREQSVFNKNLCNCQTNFSMGILYHVNNKVFISQTNDQLILNTNEGALHCYYYTDICLSVRKLDECKN